MQRNRLADETSPYLLQHANDPVDWYPWGEEALARARRENKPILLSVGYSACHWCHVMAHESFADPATADLMNRNFVNIKVDREERPDLDKIYQLAQQLITRRHGGWPLTMFLSPEDQHPFFGGTYFPKEPRHGQPGFAEVLARVAAYHDGHAAEIKRQNAALAAAFEHFAPAAPADMVVLDDAPLLACRDALLRIFDGTCGGFGQAPKFPHPGMIERGLRQWHATARGAAPDLKSLFMATLTLTRMAEGGINDQLGGGFARYSVDDRWTLPHFEKMLYDNAQLLAVYCAASVATGDPLFSRTAEATVGWLLREMQSPAHAFYSSVDADSPDGEGGYYLWSRDEVAACLDPDEYAEFAPRFGLDREANFEGRWHLHACAPPPDDDARARALATACAKLFAVRARRVRPALDEKILTSWNALTVRALALAGRALRRPDLTDAASATLDFIRATLWQGGRLLATCKDGRARLPAYLDDYVFLADALLELLQSRWRSSDLEFARALMDVVLLKFADSRGGFFYTADDHERLIHRSKIFSDDSLPSGNGIAATVLCRLGYLLGDLRYLEAAEATLVAARQMMLDDPLAHMSLMHALEEFLSSTEIIVIRGESVAIQHWAASVSTLYSPARMVLPIPADAVGLPPALAAKRAGAAVTAYFCKGMTCSAPITDLGQLARHLGSTSGV